MDLSQTTHLSQDLVYGTTTSLLRSFLAELSRAGDGAMWIQWEYSAQVSLAGRHLTCQLTGRRIHGYHRPVSDTPPPIILCLRPGFVLADIDKDASRAEFLARNVPAVSVEICYRAGKEYQFPNPVHDVLFGYDWVLKHLVPNRSFVAPGFNDRLPARIGVYGEHLGGSLATMLALTECHIKGHRIAAAAVHEPILDWILPDGTVQPVPAAGRSKKSRRSIKDDPTASSYAALLQHLNDARKDLFKRPEHWFDSFASPLLFFRTPGVAIPKIGPADLPDEFAELSLLNQQDFMRQQLQLSAMSNITDGSQQPQEPEEDSDGQSPPRKSARRYPRIDSGLSLPNMRITTGPSGILHAQAEEFTKYMRRSMIRTDELKRKDSGDAEIDAEQRMLHEVLTDELIDRRLDETAAWFRDVL